MASLADFEALVGPPEVAAPDVAWEIKEEVLGLRYPDDYKAWANRYSSLEVNDFLRISHPSMNPSEDSAEVAKRTLDGIRSVLEVGRDNVLSPDGTVLGRRLPSLPLYPDPGGLLVWGTTDNGDFCMWRTEGDPSEWKVVISDNIDWIEYDCGFLDFMVGLMRRDFICPLFPDMYFAQSAIREAMRWEPVEIDANGAMGLRGVWHTPERWREYLDELERRVDEE